MSNSKLHWLMSQKVSGLTAAAGFALLLAFPGVTLFGVVASAGVIWFIVVSAMQRNENRTDFEFLDVSSGTGEYNQQIVGESFYIDALRDIAGQGEARHETTAFLHRESDNPYDANAVAVLIDGKKVGHLSREDAADYRESMSSYPLNVIGHCPALIVGGGTDRENLGVWLDI